MKPTIDYIKTDNLVYLQCDSGRFPIAFASVAGDLIVFMNFSFPYDVRDACGRAYFHESTQHLIEDDEVEYETCDDVTKLFNLTTKRVCYFVKSYGAYLRFTKAENIKRNSNPDNVIGTWTLDKRNMPADQLRAVGRLIDSNISPETKYGTYIPTPFAKYIIGDARPNKIPIPTEKIAVNGPEIFDGEPGSQEVNYWLEIDDTGEEPELDVAKYIGDKFIGMTYVATIKEDRPLLIYEEFAGTEIVILSNYKHMAGRRRFRMHVDDGELIWRAFEASKIHDELNIHKSTNINYWLEISDTSAGREIVIAKYKGDKFVYQDWVGTIDNGVITIYDEYASAEDIIRNNFDRMGSGTRYHMSLAAGNYVWRIHEKLEKNSKKSTKTVKPTPIVTDISSKGIAPIVATKTITPLLDINSKTILI